MPYVDFVKKKSVPCIEQITHDKNQQFQLAIEQKFIFFPLLYLCIFRMPVEIRLELHVHF